MTQEMALKAVESEEKAIQHKQESVNICAMFTFSRYEPTSRQLIVNWAYISGVKGSKTN
jgi:hypothetical protein